MKEHSLKIVSIFRTIDGEVGLGIPGQWTTFVRTAGCPLRCWPDTGYCDAPHTLDFDYPHPEMTVDEIVEKVRKLGTPKVTISGGEPFSQPGGIVALARRLHAFNIYSSVETSGSISLHRDALQAFDSVVADIKCPSTKMHRKNNKKLYNQLRCKDWVKCVIQNREDYEFACDYVDKHIFPKNFHPVVAFGVRWNYLDPAKLLEWLAEDCRFTIRLNVQLHKYIYPDCEPPPVKSLVDVDYESCTAKEH